MTDHSLSVLEGLFERAAALPLESRQAFLDAECRGEPGLRAAVESLLHTDELLGPGDAFLGGPVLNARPAHHHAEPSIRIDGYRILGTLGAGGMGSVYEAEQSNPQRSVAIKVIRPEMASRETVKRFILEAQVLGRLHHPGIAQIYEAGLSEDRRPYIAMEYVRGLPLLQYAGQHSLDVAARIDLVARVCDAVHHAHVQGIIHRDLKPANILVDQAGQPRVLDFGVARAADIDLQTTAAHTQVGQLIGTLAYMSPEQIAADPEAVDHRTDVYALGVIFFELLAERAPFDLQILPLPEVARIICEREPPALGTINRLFRGDIETIVAKALEKDACKRYRSALELGDDLRRFQAREPILARPISSLARLTRWSRVHRALAGSLAVIAFLVLAVAIGSSVAALRFQDIAEQNAKARQKAEQAGAAERWERYRANIATAASALQMQNIGAARSALEAAPIEHRNWEWRHFHSQLENSRLVFDAPFPLRTVVLSPDGKRVAAGGKLKADVLVWDTVVGKRLHTLSVGDDTAVYSISPDCAWAAFGASDGLVRLFDLTTGDEVKVFRAHTGQVTALVFSTDSKSVASAGADRTLRLWDLATGKNTVVLPNFYGHAIRLALSPDGKRLLAAGDTIRLWDMEKQQPVATLWTKVGWPRAVGFSPDSRQALFATDYPDNSVHICDAVTGKLLVELRGHQNCIHDFTYSPDGRRIVTVSLDHSVRLWDSHTGKPIAVLRGHTGWALGAAFSPDGQQLASVGNDGAVRLWNADDGELIDALRGHELPVNGVTWSRDGLQLATVADDHSLRLWDLPGAAGRGVLAGHQGFIYDVACSPDGTQVASAGWDATVRVWDLATGKQSSALKQENKVVTCVAYDPSGKQLVVVTRGNEVVVWDLVTGKRRQTFKVGTDGAGVDIRATFDRQGTRVAMGSWDGSVRLWDVASGAPAGHFPVAAHPLYDVAFAPDGLKLACVAWDGTVAIWNAETQTRLAVLRGHTDRVHRVVWSKDGSRLATASNDRTVRVWNAGTALELLPPFVHASPVWGAAFSPDDNRLATACDDQSIRLWDLATGQEVAELRGHRSYVKSVTFTPDGTRLISGSGDFTVRVWDTVPVRTRAKWVPNTLNR